MFSWDPKLPALSCRRDLDQGPPAFRVTPRILFSSARSLSPKPRASPRTTQQLTGCHGPETLRSLRSIPRDPQTPQDWSADLQRMFLLRFRNGSPQHDYSSPTFQAGRSSRNRCFWWQRCAILSAPLGDMSVLPLNMTGKIRRSWHTS